MRNAVPTCPRKAKDAQLFQSSFDCIKIIDLDGRLLQMNPGATDALELDDREALYGQEWTSLWPADAKDAVNMAMATARAGKRTQFSAYSPTFKGSDGWWDVVVSPILDEDGRVDRLMAVSRETAELGRLIPRQVGHMSRLVEDLIDISRVARGLVSMEPQAVSISAVVDDAVEQVQGTLRAKAHALTFALRDDGCIVFGDHTRLVQVVGNLLGNAARYTPEGGQIDIDFKREHDLVSLAIRDTGVGIAAAKIAGPFDLYTQVDRTSDRNSSGPGLGLTLVRTLAELHGGTVSAFSAGEGAGSSFTLKIPAYGQAIPVSVTTS
jgi:PAS domain S-box-containing protein